MAPRPNTDVQHPHPVDYPPYGSMNYPPYGFGAVPPHVGAPGYHMPPPFHYMYPPPLPPQAYPPLPPLQQLPPLAPVEPAQEAPRGPAGHAEAIKHDESAGESSGTIERGGPSGSNRAMNVAVDKSMIATVAQSHPHVFGAIAELVDNSWDQAASEVQIRQGQQLLCLQRK